jgi:hypothetical protein
MPMESDGEGAVAQAPSFKYSAHCRRTSMRASAALPPASLARQRWSASAIVDQHVT